MKLDNPCTLCGEPGIPGLIHGAGKCQYHWNVGQFGVEWANEVKRRDAMNTTPLYIFDLDGTLADLKHRRHFVERPSVRCLSCWNSNDRATCICGAKHPFKPNWYAFHAACVGDTPIQPVINIVWALSCLKTEIWIWSGRMETVREQTLDWIDQNVSLKYTGPFDMLVKMRPAGDYTPDDQLKESWLHAMSPEDRARLVMVFDDRQRVVDMWRRNGIVCAQVASGDF